MAEYLEKEVELGKRILYFFEEGHDAVLALPTGRSRPYPEVERAGI